MTTVKEFVDYINECAGKTVLHREQMETMAAFMNGLAPKEVRDKAGKLVLKYVLFRIENTLVFKALHLDERFRGSPLWSKRFTTKNGVVVSSPSYIDLRADPWRIHVRPSCCWTKDFKDYNDAESWMWRYDTALADWADRATEFVKSKHTGRVVDVEIDGEIHKAVVR